MLFLLFFSETKGPFVVSFSFGFRSSLSPLPTLLSTSFRKSFFCFVLYTEEVNLQNFVMI